MSRTSLIAERSRWHYRVAGETVGPVDLAALRQALGDLRDDADVHVREDGSDAWLRAAEVPGLLGPFAGPTDPDWPNSPTKVFLYLSAAIAAFDLDQRYRVPVVLPGAAIAIAYTVLRDRGSRSGDAVPLACVIGLACAFAVADALTLFAPTSAAMGALDVLGDTLVPIALATWYLARPSAIALRVLIGLEGIELAIYALAASDWRASVVTPIAVHAAALLGLARIAMAAPDSRTSSGIDVDDREHL